MLQSYRFRKLGLHAVYTCTIFHPNGRGAKLLKVNKQQMPRVFLLRAFCLFRGSWRIRTAVHGFADRWLSHSSKEPYCYQSLFLDCGCKGTTFFLICKYFAIFFSLFCIFFATALWLVVHRLHGAIRITAFTRIAIVLYALEILKDTYTYPYCTEAYDCNNYNFVVIPCLINK